MLWGLFLTERETLVQVEPDRPAPTPGAAMVYGRQEPGWPLGWILETMISSSVDPEMRKAMQEIAGYEWMLTLCVEPAFATISYRYGNRRRGSITTSQVIHDGDAR